MSSTGSCIRTGYPIRGRPATRRRASELFGPHGARPASSQGNVCRSQDRHIRHRKPVPASLASHRARDGRDPGSNRHLSTSSSLVHPMAQRTEHRILPLFSHGPTLRSCLRREGPSSWRASMIASIALHGLNVQQQLRRLVQSSTADHVRTRVCITTGAKLRGPEGSAATEGLASFNILVRPASL